MKHYLKATLIFGCLISTLSFGSITTFESSDDPNQITLSKDTIREYFCDDLKGEGQIIKEKTCLDALRTYNTNRKNNNEPTCSVRRLHKNPDGCYCFPPAKKGGELTNMCQEKTFYQNDQRRMY